MKKLLYIFLLVCVTGQLAAQENMKPAREHHGYTYIKNATIHVGNGKVINNGVIRIKDNKIEAVGENVTVPADAVDVVDAKGKHVYPGLILPISNLGLVETSSVRA